MSNLEKPKLRDRMELETQLATEISLGALKSLDAAISQDHKAALEYGAQMLFDNVRTSVAEKENLPINIACYLYFDRNINIKHQLIRNNFFNLPKDYQEDFLSSAETFLGQCDDIHSWKSPGRNMVNLIQSLRTLSINKDDMNDQLICRLTKMPKVYSDYDIAPSRKISTLRLLPKTVKYCYERQLTNFQTSKWKDNEEEPHVSNILLELAHPDEEIRFKAIKYLCSLKAQQLRDKVHEFDNIARKGKNTPGDIRKAFYSEIADDPSLKIQLYIVSHARHSQVLKELAEQYKEINPQAAKIAAQEAEKIAKRTKYTQEYQRKRAEKTREERRAKYGY